MSVVLGSSGTAVGSAVTTLDLVMSVESTVGALVAGVTFDAAVTSVSLTWDNGGTNQAMTQLVALAGGTRGRVELYGLLAPTTVVRGTLRAAWTTASVCRMGAIAWNHVNQAGGNGTFQVNNANANSTTPSVTVRSLGGDACMDCVLDQENTSLSANTQTRLLLDATGSVTSGGMSYAVGASPTVALAWTINVAEWCSVGVNIQAAAVPYWKRVGNIARKRRNYIPPLGGGRD